jgi:hypothetical protein
LGKEIEVYSLRLRLSFSQDKSDRYVWEKENEKNETLHEHDAIEVHQVHLVLRQSKQRAVHSINEIASQQIDAEPQQQE